MEPKRLMNSINFDLMQSTKIVGIGSGGASGLYEDLVRTGLGQLTVVDFDIVDASNLCTQGYGVADIGKPKVTALEQRLLAINPQLNYTPIKSDVLKMTEEEVDSLVSEANLLLFMTDNFYAQARGNRIALKYQIPAIFAIVYYRARCAEITFTIPGITPACHRCATSSRYKAYQQGYKNDVTSTGSNIMQTHYLNACLGLLSLAILHRGHQECELGRWFVPDTLWQRNLVQIRMSPLYGEEKPTIFQKTFQGCERVFTFDAIWQLVEVECPPKYPACPDCGGTGDLRRCKKTVDSTLLLSASQP